MTLRKEKKSLNESFFNRFTRLNFFIFVWLGSALVNMGRVSIF